MKKLAALILAGVMIFALAGCAQSNEPQTPSSQPSGAQDPGTQASDPQPATTEPSVAIDWPNKSITVYVPASPGGTTDNTCRVLCDYLEKELGTSFAIVNQTGASGGIAADAMMDADPDGYTLMYYHNTMMTAYITGAVDYVATDVMKVMSVNCRDYPNAIVVRSDSKYQTLQDLVDDIAANPETVRIGVETGGGSFLMAKLFESSVGGQLRYLDYGTDSERVAGLLGGHLDMIFLSVGSALSYEESGDFRMLAAVGETRNPLAPELETCKEQGVDFVWGGQIMAWFGQKDLPDEIVEKFNTAVEKALSDPEIEKALNDLSFYPSYEGSEDATKTMNDWLNDLMPYKELMS